MSLIINHQNSSINKNKALLLNKKDNSVSSLILNSSDVNNELQNESKDIIKIHNTANKSNSNNRDENFSKKNILKSVDHPFTINAKSSYTSYFYTNTNTILNKLVMSYEEQLHKAITKGNYELCKELIEISCDINKEFDKKFPLCKP
jgi:hypothetical protein